MNVGRFRELIEIRRPGEAVTDAYGRRSVPYETVCEVRAGASDVSGRDYWDAAAHQLQHTITFDMRYRTDVDASCVIIWRGDTWQIDQVNHLGYMGDFMRIRARKIDPQGS